MKIKEAIELLKKEGDPIEREIITYWNDLTQVLSPYCGIWAHHIHPRRNPDNRSFVTDNWMPFAGSHYTAIVRIANAFEKWKRIQFICSEFEAGRQTGKLLLEAHDVVASFWEHIGSASENLSHCLEDAPCIKKGEANKYVQINFPVIDQAYDRRTQLIHYRLVPMGSDGGLLYFNMEDFKTKDTNWKEKIVRPVFTADYYQGIWSEVLREMADLWSKIEQWLRDVDEGPFKFQPTPEQAIRKKTHKVFKRPSGYEPPSMITYDWEEIEVQELPPIHFPDIGPSGVQ